MKKLIAVFIILGCLLALSGCTSSNSKDTGASLSPISGQTIIDQITTQVKNVFED